MVKMKYVYGEWKMRRIELFLPFKIFRLDLMLMSEVRNTYREKKQLCSNKRGKKEK